MFRLTREVRLGLASSSSSPRSPNGHAAYPPLELNGRFCTVRVTLAGELERDSGYVINIKHVDQLVRREGLPLLQTNDGNLLNTVFDRFIKTWPNLSRLEISFSPYTRFSIHATERPMVRLSQKYEFSAAHRLHNPSLSEAKNVELFGKCNNPHGHGHNYELEVSIRGLADGNGRVIALHELDDIVARTVIQRFDHKFLNLETAEFADLNPTVENISRTIYKMLKPVVPGLAAVTVWETPKTWCQYSEDGNGD